MRNKIYLLALLLLLMHLPTLAQIGGDYNPNNPGDLGTPVQKYTLTLKGNPADAGNFNITSTKLAAGENYTIKAYSNQSSNPGFVFVAWLCDGDTISKSASYTITMPAHDLEIIGVYTYDPSSPSDPNPQATKYQLTILAEPMNSGSFNINSERYEAGSVHTLYAYTNTDFVFKHWRIGDTILSTNQNMDFTMPAHNVTIIGQFEYDPANPANPNANYWNPLTGEVIVDDFQPGMLSNAISTLLNRYGANKNDVQSIIVAGQMTSNDFGIANTYSNCAILDISRVTGITEIPSYAFDYTNLESVYLPASIEKIGNSAFYQCTKLYSLTVYAMTPPQLGSSVFSGVPEGLVVYVPAAALTLYQNNPNWNKYILLPIQDGIISLTVNLPSGANPADYAHMWLELTNTKNGQRMHLVMTDNKMSYKFNNIICNTSWDVVLRNPNGDIFGQIENVEVGDEDVSVTFTSLSKPYNVTLSVLTPLGQDVTSQAEVTWTDADGNYITQEPSIAGLPLGYQLIYSVKLPQQLAMAYNGPSDTQYTVKNGNNTIVCHLTAISNVTVSGKVKDGNTGLPIKGANVTASQTFGGKYDKTISATTNNSGEFTFEIAKVPTVFGASANDYINKSLAFDVMAATGNIVLPDLSLDPITGATISINFTYTPCHTSDEEAEPQNWYSDFNNVDYSIYNKTKNRSLDQFSAQYPQLVLLEDVNDGDVLELTATSRKNAFKPVKATVTIAEQKANATFNIIELGKIAASFKNNSNPSVTGTLYDSNGKLLTCIKYSDASLEISDLNDGNYSLITMGESRFFNTIYDISQFSQSGLVSGIDYVRTAVQVQSGIISKVEINNVPLLDESKLYYTGDNTSFTVNKPNIVIGGYLTLTGHLNFKPEYATQVSNVQMIIDLPESCAFVENSVMVGNSTSDYYVDGNQITIPMARYTDRVRFCVVPTLIGDYAPSAFARFDIDSHTITQPIGNATFTADGLSISVPSTVNKTSIPISGTAVGVCDISIYDNDMLIGQTKSLANGSWMMNCELCNPYNFSTHVIYAKVTTSLDLELITERVPCLYDKNSAQISKVTQYNEQRGPTPYLMTFDFLNPSTTSQHYSYDMYDNNRTFTYTIDFNNNKAVDNVTLYVKTVLGHWWPLDARYDEEKDLWVTAGEFGDSQNGDLPLNVAVDYQTKSVLELDDSYLQSEYSWINGIETDVTVNDPEDEQTNEYDTLSDQDLLDFLRSQNDSVPNIDGYEGLDSHEFSVNTDDGRTIIIKMCSCSDLSEELVKNDSNYLVMQKTTGLPLYVKRTETVADYIDFENNVRILLAVDSSNSSLSSSALTLNANRDFISTVSGYIVSFSGLINSIDDETRFIRNTLENMKRASSFNYAEAMAKFNKYDGIVKTLEKRIFNAIDPQWKAIWEAELYRAYNLKNLYRRNAEAALKTINNIKAVLGKLSSIFSFSINAKKGYDAMVEWKQILESIQSSECPGMDELYNKACSYTRLIFTFYFCAAKADLASLIALKGKITGVLSLALFNISIHSSNWGDLMQTIWTNEIRNKIPITNNCDPGPDPNQRPPVPEPKGHKHQGADLDHCIDPSGFVYEGVPSNRLQGVTATCFYKETVEDMYGDLHDEVVLWDATQYGQENPLFTDENGYYRWDVPIGMWQVKYEKEGYETTYSDWLPVPPPQLDVNIGMTQMRQPEVIKARAYTKAVEFEFDKYMKPETLTTDNISVTANGVAVNGTVQLLNEEQSYEGEETFASRVRFNATNPFNADEVTLYVCHKVENYAGLRMSDDYVQTLTVEYEIEKIDVDTTINVLYGDSRQLIVTALPARASKGKTLTVSTLSPLIISTDAECYTLDNNGQAVVTVHGDLPGMGSLLFGIDGYDVAASTEVNVIMENQMNVATPTASVASGSEVPKGTAVYLRCATEGATIYYTLDGSCPCDDTPARKVYDGTPIIISGDITIKAMATAPDLFDSDVATFVYRVNTEINGDVNRDGEVNIADINVVIDVILSSNVNPDVSARADVNGDGEVNIADINVIIDIILNPNHHMSQKVNCDDKIHLDNVTLKSGEVRTLQVTLDNASHYSAMQCDIVLPAGLTLIATNAIGSNVSKIGSIDETSSRALSYSPTKVPFASNGQSILTLTVRADETLEAESEIVLTHVILADAENKAWHLADCKARVNNTSGVNDLTVVSDKVWVEGHTLFIEARHEGTAQLATINGIVCDIPVKAGVNQHRLDQGIYIVVVNGNSHKIAIK